MFSFLHHFASHIFFSIRYDSLVNDTHEHKLQNALNKRIQESSSRRDTTRRHQNRANSRRSLLSSVHVTSSTDLLENKTEKYDFADSTPPLSICIDSLHWVTEHFVQGSKWSLHSRENTSRLQFITSLINATKNSVKQFPREPEVVMFLSRRLRRHTKYYPGAANAWMAPARDVREALS